MLKLYFGGAEIPGWRTLLADLQVTHLGISFVGLLRRTKLKRPWRISEKFPPWQHVLLDSGGYTLNTKPDKYSAADIEDLAIRYRNFVETNLDAVELVTELDALAMGSDWIARQRSDFYDSLPGEKFLPIWHVEQGLAELERLAERYGRVGVPQTSAGGRDIAGMLNRLARHGVKLHGVAMTKISLMESIAWDSVASTSWLSVAQYGDSQIWTGHELKRYPKNYREQGRKRHRTYLASQGFDVEAYEYGDVTESLKVAVWSWQRFVDHLNNRPTKHAVTMIPDQAPGGNAENTNMEVEMQREEARKNIPTPADEDDGERMLLPGLTLSMVTRSELGKDGEKVEKQEPLVGISERSTRQCDTCYLASKCRAYRPGHSCAYDIPIMLKTRDQYTAAEDALISMQFQRVAFMRLVEEAEGGYADPNLSKEIDLLHRMLERRRDHDSQTFSLSVKASARAEGGAGLIARLFGRDASEQARALPQPVPSDQLISELGLGEPVEAEVIDDGTS